VKTASEWLAENLCTDPEVDWLELNYEQAAELIAKIQLDVRIATLREAARMVCPWCDEGIELRRDKNGGGAVVTYVHIIKHGMFVGCKTPALHESITELEAERGKEGEVT